MTPTDLKVLFSRPPNIQSGALTPTKIKDPKNYEAIIRNFLFSKNLDASGRIVYKNSYQNPRA